MGWNSTVAGRHSAGCGGAGEGGTGHVGMDAKEYNVPPVVVAQAIRRKNTQSENSAGDFMDRMVRIIRV